MKIGIIVREETMGICTGQGCLNAFNQRKDAFARYADEADTLELLTFTHSGGDLKRKIKMMHQLGIETVHLSSCLRARSQAYASLLEELSEHFTVVGYTHGPEVRVQKVQNRKGLGN